MKRVLILHGWGANSQSNWFPWLKKTLEKNRILVYCPDLPESEKPELNRWLAAAEIAKPFDNTLSAVGHSLGAVALLRLLERLGENEKIGTVALASCFARDIGIAEIKNFLETPFDWKKIRKKAERFVVMHCDNDPIVPAELGKEVADRLDAEFVLEHGCGHLNAGTGDFTYPRIARLLGGAL